MIQAKPGKRWRRLLSWGRPVLGIVFVASSIPKLSFPLEFLSSVYGYELVGPETGVLVAILLPWLELVVGMLLILDVFSFEAAALATVMLLVFLSAQGYAIMSGLNIGCGCFASSETIGSSTLLRTSALFTLAILLLVLESREAGPAEPGHSEASAAHVGDTTPLGVEES